MDVFEVRRKVSIVGDGTCMIHGWIMGEVGYSTLLGENSGE